METSMKKMVFAITLSFIFGSIYHPQASAAETGTLDEVSGKPCYKCHASKVTAPFVHSGLSGKECTPCHTATGGNHQSNTALYGVKDKSSKVCYECHENQTSKKSVHPPIMENDCLGCHAPHASNYKYQLGLPVNQLCFNCHDKSLVADKETEKNGFRDGVNNLHNLHAGEKNAIPCLSCHDIHASTQLHMIRPKGTNGKDAVTTTYTTTPKGGNCTTSCHDALGYERK
jgi:predicted CXXCH cytochrome family protein